MPPQGLVFANRAGGPHLVYLPTRTSGRHAPKVHNLHLDYYMHDAYRQLLSFRADPLRVHELFTSSKECYYIAICPLQCPFNWVNYHNAKNNFLTRLLPKATGDVDSPVWFGNVTIFKTSERSVVVDINQEDVSQIVNEVVL